MSFLLFVGIFIGGGAGAWLRFTLDTWLKSKLTPRMPLGIFMINLAGSFLLGSLTGATGLLTQHLGGEAAQTLTLVAGTGLLGGFTTFSTAMVEVVTATHERRPKLGLLLWLGQALACLSVAWLGLAIFQ